MFQWYVLFWPELLKHSFTHERKTKCLDIKALFKTRHWVWEKFIKKKAFGEKLKSLLLCPVQVLTQLTYCRSKQVKRMNSWTVRGKKTLFSILDLRKRFSNLSQSARKVDWRTPCAVDIIQTVFFQLSSVSIFRESLEMHWNTFHHSRRYSHSYDRWYML